MEKARKWARNRNTAGAWEGVKSILVLRSDTERDLRFDQAIKLAAS